MSSSCARLYVLQSQRVERGKHANPVAKPSRHEPEMLERGLVMLFPGAGMLFSFHKVNGMHGQECGELRFQTPH